MGKIIRIGCNKGYFGSFENKIKPSSFPSDLLAFKNGFVIDNGVIVRKEIKGIEIDLPEKYSEFDKLEEVPDFEIQRIYVVQIV